MASNSDTQPWIDRASAALGVPLFARGATASGPCPTCRTGTDRLTVWADGNAWCRRCDAKLWWGERATKEEIDRAQEAKAGKQRHLREQMAGCTDWLGYLEAVDLEAWALHGVEERAVRRWGLGTCANHPWLDVKTLTIPVFQFGKLVDIRHRVLDDESAAGKYRSHLPGLRPAWFGLDVPAVAGSPVLYVVEGEKKAIILNEAGIASIAYPGSGFYPRLPDVLARMPWVKTVVNLPDPDNFEFVLNHSAGLKVEALIVELPEKPDDMLIRDREQFLRSLRYAKSIEVLNAIKSDKRKW